MKYDIYFHNDFDGRASSAVMLAFLRSRGDDIGHYIPLKYDIIPQWLDEKFFEKHKLFRGDRNPAIIVDFPFHPGAVFWFEHHPTTFKKPIWEKKFRPTKYLHYEPRRRSACHVVCEALEKDWGWQPPANLRDLVKWLDVIDGAQYESAKQTIEMKEPALQISSFIETMERMQTKPADEKWIVEMLSRKSLSAIAREPKIKAAVNRIRKGIKSGLAFYKSHFEIEGCAGFIDLTGKSMGNLRYAAYYLYPALAYNIRLTKDRVFHLSVGANPWSKRHNQINIGKFLKKYGGGGHFGVGGAEFYRKQDALRAVKETVAFLNT